MKMLKKIFLIFVGFIFLLFLGINIDYYYRHYIKADLPVEEIKKIAQERFDSFCKDKKVSNKTLQLPTMREDEYDYEFTTL